MFRTVIDGIYGVRMLDDRAICRMDTEPTRTQLMFDGFPVFIDDACIKSIRNKKRWKRLNRPDKVRIRNFDKPMMYMARPPLVPRPTIICHSKIVELLGPDKGRKE